MVDLLLLKRDYHVGHLWSDIRVTKLSGCGDLDHTETRSTLVVAVVCSMLLGACTGQRADVGPNGCSTFSGVLTLDRRALVDLVGVFEIVVSATDGAPDGQLATGVMTLHANIDELALMSDGAGGFIDNVVVPYYGTSDIDMAIVGALPLGGARSDDPTQPGLVFIQTNSSSGNPQSVVVRMGVDGNQRNAVRFDGGYTVLRAQYVTRDSMGGEWASGQLNETAKGCWKAVRQAR